MGKIGIKQISTPDDLALSKASPLLWATRSTLAADLLQHQPRCQGALEAASIVPLPGCDIAAAGAVSGDASPK